MKCILKPKWKKSVSVTTEYFHKTDKTKAASSDEVIRYEEFEVELAEGITVEELQTWDDFDLNDTTTFVSYEMLNNPLSGDVTHCEWETTNSLDDEEQELIMDGCIWDLEDWESTNSYTYIQCECEVVPLS